MVSFHAASGAAVRFAAARCWLVRATIPLPLT